MHRGASIKANSAPFKTTGFRTTSTATQARRTRPQEKGNTLSLTLAAVLFALAVFATLSLSLSDPIWVWCAEGATLLLGAILSVRNVACSIFFLPCAGIAVWGFAQLTAGATVYRYATLDASLRFAAYCAAAWAAMQLSPTREEWNRWFGIVCWFSVILSIGSVLA